MRLLSTLCHLSMICLLVSSIRNNVKIAADPIVQGIVLATRTCHTSLLGLESTLFCLDFLLLERIFLKCKLCFFEQGISRSIFISIRYTYIKTNKVIHNPGSQVVLYILPTNVGVLPLHGLIVASLRTNQIYIKRDKVKIKPYIHHNRSIG